MSKRLKQNKKTLWGLSNNFGSVGFVISRNFYNTKDVTPPFIQK